MQEVLGKVKLFEVLSSKHLDRIAKELEAVSYADKQTIFEQEAVGDAFYVIESGNVSVVSTRASATKKKEGEAVRPHAILHIKH